MADTFDAGILGDYDSGDVQWWHTYIRTLLSEAHEFYSEQVDEHQAMSDAAADEIERLSLFERAMIDMAAQFVNPKLTAEDLARSQLGPAAAEAAEEIKRLQAIVDEQKPFADHAKKQLSDYNERTYHGGPPGARGTYGNGGPGEPYGT